MKRTKLMNVWTHIVLLIFLVLVIYPFLWMLSVSLKDMQDLLVNTTNLVPKKLHFENYATAFKMGKIGRYYINSIIIAISSLFLVLVATYLGAYALVRMNLPGRRFIMIAFVSCIMIPMQVVMIPLLKFEAFIRINNTYWGLIFPYTAYSLPFGIFVMAAFLRTIPLDIEEAGMLDGCNRLQTILHILLPISRPGFATVFIFTFMAIWNEFVLAMIIIQNQSLSTLNLGLLNFKRSFGSLGMEPNLMFAGLTMVAAPMIIVYAVFQKQFISGLIAGSIKS